MSTLKLIKLLSNEILQATSLNTKSKSKHLSSFKKQKHFHPNKTHLHFNNNHRPISTDNANQTNHKLKTSKNLSIPTNPNLNTTSHKKSRNTNDNTFLFKSRNISSSVDNKNGMSFVFDHFTIKSKNNLLTHNDSYYSMSTTNKDSFNFMPIQRKDTQVLDKYDSMLVKKQKGTKLNKSSSPFSKNYSNDISSNDCSPAVPKRCNSIDRLYNESLSKNLNWALSKDKLDIVTLPSNTTVYSNISVKPFSLLSSSKNLSLNQILSIHEDNIKIASNEHRNINPNILPPSPKKVNSIHGRSFAGIKPSGAAKANQDSFFIEKNFLSLSNQLFIGVCDGHGELGHFASNFISKNLHVFVSNALISNAISYVNSTPDESCLNTIISSFKEANTKLTSHQLFDVSLSGTTCSSVIINSKCLYCLNVGDSRTVLGKCSSITNQFYVEELSEDHKPENENEKQRIIENGGRVDTLKSIEGKSIGPYRLWLKDYNTPGLAMSRSFGDTIAASVGLIAVPQIKIHEFTKEDKFIICASDGLWEFVSSKESVQIVKEFYLKRNINGAINKLYEVAKGRWIKNEESSDDITIVLVFFDDL